MTHAEQAAVYAQEIMRLKRIIAAIVEAYRTPHYGDYEAAFDRLFEPMQEARKA